MPRGHPPSAATHLVVPLLRWQLILRLGHRRQIEATKVIAEHEQACLERVTASRQCTLVGKPVGTLEHRSNDPTQPHLPTRPLGILDRRELRRRHAVQERSRVADLAASRAARREHQQGFTTPRPLLAKQRIKHGNRSAHTAVIDWRTRQIEQGVNLGQARIETLDTASVEVIQVIVTVERHESGHLFQVPRQLAFGRQPVQERNGAPHAAPTKNLQTRLKRLLLITCIDRTRQPLTQLPQRALGFSPGFRLNHTLVGVVPACLPAIVLKYPLNPLEINRQTARYKLAGLEAQLERERRQVGCQPCNERFHFGLCQELFTLHAGRLADNIEWPYPKQNGRPRPRCLFIQVNKLSRF